MTQNQKNIIQVDQNLLKILTKINIVLYALGEAVEEGFIELKWISKTTDEIESLINSLEKQNETDQKQNNF